MKPMNFAALSISLFLCLIAGVRGIAADEKAAKDGTKEGAAKAKVTLQIVDWDETLMLVAAHKGKVVVLDAWSTSCQPCMKEFPNLVKLHRKIQATKGRLRLCGLRPVILDAFKVSQFDKIFEIFPDEASALKKF